jgi:hypothetical protein
MRVFCYIATLLVLGTTHALVPQQSTRWTTTMTRTTGKGVSSRSAFLSTAVAAFVTTSVVITVVPLPAAWAMPVVTTDEFTSIIRDSARSIERVEFSGPKSEIVVVRLVDGTFFGIKDVVESSTDPRSPLKIAAMCNANKIPYKFVDIEAALAASPRKKKVYANSRVLEAAEKQKEKALRMQQDEELRQSELAEMRGQ